jgi:hypothetical protein
MGDSSVRGWRMILGLVCVAGAASAAAPLARTSSAPDQHDGTGVSATAHAHELDGVWMERRDSITFTQNDPPLLPWAAERFRAAKPGYGPHASAESQDPVLSCLPPGVPRILLMPFPMQIAQVPGEVLMIFEYDHFLRSIYTDGRAHPKDPDPTWMGNSVGRWEGDTLVVDTTGFNDKTWLDMVGHPHSDALHVMERIRRVDHDTLQDDVTIIDPRAYSKPWTGQQTFELKPSWHLGEYICEDNMADPPK